MGKKPMYPFRKEIVGKRFLFVRSSDKGSRLNSRSTRASNPLEYQWRGGIIRACSEKDFHAKELQVLVEYEGEDWTTREWLPVYAGGFKIFLLENNLVLAQRPDPSNMNKAILWPALTFLALVDLHKLENEPYPIPVEFLGDHKRLFVKPTDLRAYQDEDGLQPSFRNNLKVVEDLASWQRLQKSQAILMEGPFTLTGNRVQVYRKNLRQWFSAVITSHDLLTRELRVMDDTVLQTHNVEPALVQVVLLVNDAELDNLLRGETSLRVLPVRQHRQSQVIISSTCTLASTTSTPTSVSSWQLFQELARGVTDHPAGNLVTLNQPRHEASYGQQPARSISTYIQTTDNPMEATQREQRPSSKHRKSSEKKNCLKENATSFTTEGVTSSSNSSLTVSQASQLTNYLNSSHDATLSRQDITDDDGDSNLSSPNRTTGQLQNNQQSQILKQPTHFQEAAFHSVLSPRKQSFHAVSSSPGVIGITSPCRTSVSCALSSSSPSSSHSSPKDKISNSSPAHQVGLITKISMSASSYSTSAASSNSKQRANTSGTFLSQIQSIPPPAGPACVISSKNHQSHSSCQLGHHSMFSPSPSHDHLHLLQNQQAHLQQCQRANSVQNSPSQLDIHQQYQQYQCYLMKTYNQIVQRYLMACHQLQLLSKQHRSPDQQRTLKHYQSQVLFLCQDAQLVQKLAADAQFQFDQNVAQFERHMQLLPDQIQQQIHTVQEHQEQHPRLEPEKLQAFFHQIQQQSPSPEQISELYGQLVEQQQLQKALASTNKPNIQNTQYRHYERQSLMPTEQQRTTVEQGIEEVLGLNKLQESQDCSNSNLLSNKRSPNHSTTETTIALRKSNNLCQQQFEFSSTTAFASKSTSQEDVNHKDKADKVDFQNDSSKEINTGPITTLAAEIAESKALNKDVQGKQRRKKNCSRSGKRNPIQSKTIEEQSSKKPKVSDLSRNDDSRQQESNNETSSSTISRDTISDEILSVVSRHSQCDGIAHPSLPGAFSGLINLDYMEKLANTIKSGPSRSDSSNTLVSNTSNLDSSCVKKQDKPVKAVSSASVECNKESSLSSSEFFLHARDLATESPQTSADKFTCSLERLTRTNSTVGDFASSEIIAHNRERPSVIKISPAKENPEETLIETKKGETVSDDVVKMKSIDGNTQKVNSSLKKSAPGKPRSKKRKEKEIDSENNKNKKSDNQDNIPSEINAKEQVMKSVQLDQLFTHGSIEGSLNTDPQHLTTAVFSTEQITSKSKGKKKSLKSKDELAESSTFTPAEVQTTCVHSLPGYRSKSQLSSDFHIKETNTDHSLFHLKDTSVNSHNRDLTPYSFDNLPLSFVSDKDVENLAVDKSSDSARTKHINAKKKRERKLKNYKDSTKKVTKTKKKIKKLSDNFHDAYSNHTRDLQSHLKSTAEHIVLQSGTESPNSTINLSFEEKLDIIYSEPEEFVKEHLSGASERLTTAALELTPFEVFEKDNKDSLQEQTFVCSGFDNLKSVRNRKERIEMPDIDSPEKPQIPSPAVFQPQTQNLLKETNVDSLTTEHKKCKMLCGKPTHNEVPDQISEAQDLLPNEIYADTHKRNESKLPKPMELYSTTRLQSSSLVEDKSKVLSNPEEVKISLFAPATIQSVSKSLNNQLHENQPPGCSMIEQQSDSREEKSAMETVSRLLAEKRESLQKARNKKIQQLKKQVRQGRRRREGKKQKKESSLNETSHLTLEFNPAKNSPLQHLSDKDESSDIVRNTLKHPMEESGPKDVIENSSQSNKDVSFGTSKSLEMIKQSIRQMLSKKSRHHDSTVTLLKQDVGDEFIEDALMPDNAVGFLQHSPGKETWQQEHLENSVNNLTSQGLLTHSSNSLDGGTQEEHSLEINEELSEDSEEKRFNELKSLLKAKKHFEAKKLCEDKSIKDETKHAVVKELIQEEKNNHQDTSAENGIGTTEPKPVEIVDNKMKNDTTEVKAELPVGSHVQELLKQGGETGNKEGEHGKEVVFKRKRGRPRKYWPEGEKKLIKGFIKPVAEGSEVPKKKRGRKKKAAVSDGHDDGPLRKKKKKENKIKKEKEGNGKQIPEEFFIQDGACSKFPKLPMCRECREIAESQSPSVLECCRFNLFRRLKRRKYSKVVCIAGFLLPEHASQDDKIPWETVDKMKNALDKDKALYILERIGDEFCSLVEQERAALGLARPGAPVTYKRAVRGVREMCDVCATTIFNIHWVCHRCGFGVCLDCYRLRLKERSQQPAGTGVKRVFEFRWKACSPGFQHQPKFLNVAQIIPQNLLNNLLDELHAVRRTWHVNEGKCPCWQVKANIKDITDGTSEESTKISEVLHSLEVPDVKQETDSVIGEAEKETAWVSAENIERTNGQEPVPFSTDAQNSRLLCNEKLDPQSSEEQENHQDKLDARPDKGALLRALPNVKGDKLHPVVSLFDVCSNSDKIKWKEKALKIQPIKFTAGLNLLMDYETSSGESTPLESPCIKKGNSQSSSHTSFAFQSAPEREPLNDNLNLLAHLASLHGVTAAKENNTPADQTENKVKVKSVLNSSGDEPELVSSCPTKNAFKDETQRQETAMSPKPLMNPLTTFADATAVEGSEEATARARCALKPQTTDTHPAPHSWFCDGRLLRLHQPHSEGNLKAFQQNWTKGQPVLVSHVDEVMDLKLWTPESFEMEFGSEISDVVNCKTGTTIPEYEVGAFWRGFESMKDRPKDSSGNPMILKLKDWPPGADFCEKLPSRFEDLMANIPVPEYTTRNGERNLAARLPDFFVKPDLGPKMYNAYGSAAFPHEGTTNLHVDMSDAVNVMMYVGVPKDPGVAEREREYAIAAVDAACDEVQQQRVRVETDRIGAMWHIYPAQDADKIRACLRQHAQEMKMKYPAHHDPIHDQCFYLDHDLRERLRKEYNVEGYAICQCLGDAIFIPAGAPHQVRNLYNCIKVAEDFVSPEHIHKCFEITQEFRHLSDKHTNHEDKLQIKNMIFHAVKDAIGALKKLEDETNNEQGETVTEEQE